MYRGFKNKNNNNNNNKKMQSEAVDFARCRHPANRTNHTGRLWFWPIHSTMWKRRHPQNRKCLTWAPIAVPRSEPRPQVTCTENLANRWQPAACLVLFYLCFSWNSCNSYLTEWCTSLHPYVPSRTLRSSSANLYIPRTNLHFRSRSFHIAAPTVWISLPSTLRSSQTLNTFPSFPVCF